LNDLSDRLSIDTPENVLLDAEVAGFGTRCIAATIDYTVLFILLVVFTYLFARSVSRATQNTATTIAILVAVQFILITFYHLLFELFWNGQTPGKRLLGVRVVQSNGLPLTVSGAIIRNLVRLFDYLPVFYGVGLLVMFVSKHTQRLGDLAARTVVIRDRRLKVETVKETLKIHYLFVNAVEPIPAYIHVDRLSPADQRTVIDYLQRRLGFRDREEIAHIVAQQIAAKMEDSVAYQEASISPQRAERFLEHVARAFEIGRV
jgi:uncharacterized RDD family membrane protein YckC